MPTSNILNAPHEKPCPTCGRCPTCGHTPPRLYPAPYPYYPQWHTYPSGTTPIMTGGSSGVMGSAA